MEAAKAYMREMRSKVKDIPGGAFKDPEVQRAASLKGIEAKRKKREENSPTEEELRSV